MIFCRVGENLPEEFVKQLMRRAVAVGFADSAGDENPDATRLDMILVDDIAVCLFKLRQIKRRVG